MGTFDSQLKKGKYRSLGLATPSNFCRPATPTVSLLFAAPRPERPSDPANPGYNQLSRALGATVHNGGCSPSLIQTRAVKGTASQATTLCRCLARGRVRTGDQLLPGHHDIALYLSIMRVVKPGRSNSVVRVHHYKISLFSGRLACPTRKARDRG